MLGGEVSMAIINPVSTMPHVKAGKLKLLAVTTSRRVPSLPDVPTVAESGVPGFENVIWNGISVRAGTPAPIVERLNREVVKASTSPGMKEHLARDGATVFGTDTPQDFARFIDSEIAKWAAVVKKAGIRSH
jgi:tripartite-type tricarboxylate transporter receptor subunit TctC